MIGMQMADVNLGDVSGGETLLGQASAGIAAAVDQEPPFRRVDQDIGLVVVQGECRAGSKENQLHGRITRLQPTKLVARIATNRLWTRSSAISTIPSQAREE